MRTRFYTLIEILVVMVIAGVLISAAAPAFSKLMQGSSTGQAARELTGKLNAARAYALANRTNVAVVFPRASEGFPNNYSYTAYRVCEVYLNGSNWEFKRWIPGENWKFLPSGTLLGVKKPDANRVYSSGFSESAFQKSKSGNEEKTDGDASSPSIAITNTQTEINGLSATLQPIHNALIFRTDGTLANMQSIILPIVEGRWTPSGELLLPGELKAYIPVVVRGIGKVVVYNQIENFP